MRLSKKKLFGIVIAIFLIGLYVNALNPKGDNILEKIIYTLDALQPIIIIILIIHWYKKYKAFVNNVMKSKKFDGTTKIGSVTMSKRGMELLKYWIPEGLLLIFLMTLADYTSIDLVGAPLSTPRYLYCRSERLRENSTKMSLQDAMEIAEKSDCRVYGEITDSAACNENSATWWINIDPKEEMPDCNPACVVNIISGKATYDDRCK